MILNIVFILAGIVLVLWGADRLTDGAVGLAERMHVSQLVIGLTIVAFGTSAPEFCVSLVSALKGTADLAVGNIVGSNVFNTLLIVGVTALVAPMTILKTTVNRDLPFAFLASTVLIVLCYFGRDVSRLDALVLLGLFAVFMYLAVRGAKSGEEDAARPKNMPVWKGVMWVIVGLACLVGGSNVFVEGATAVARYLGVSDAVIGLTIVAGGTSLPELATSVVAARRGNSGIAIGNVLGSNVFNICFILGATGLITPLAISGITYLDMTMLVLSSGLLWLFSFTKYTIARWEGGVLMLIYLAYLSWLVVNAL
ncbi:calcium/sodium antiporter [Prevotella sp. KH2C16]|uniref:calcium/sodium antiporter n=1 Tax=Prevotella sp. KH2C16 TaxID=1855325 RepID=UPI0008F11B1B|nr:calcium/sodium antiporter [Prevotella sp. KH2C16]SFG24674.1 cation:H+ antiporter [Prevotella sp. KH2C16]